MCCWSFLLKFKPALKIAEIERGRWGCYRKLLQGLIAAVTLES